MFDFDAEDYFEVGDSYEEYHPYDGEYNAIVDLMEGRYFHPHGCPIDGLPF